MARLRKGSYRESHEGVVHGPSRSIELRHRFDTDDQLHRSEHARCRVHGRIDRAATNVWADCKCYRAMSIDMITAVLDIVLDYKDRALGPELALGDRFDDFA